MKAARILSPLHSLGPGERVGIWTRGCSKSCPGCISPELQDNSGEDIPPEMLAAAVKGIANMRSCTGLTVSGGDPLEQAEDLLIFLRSVRDAFDDVLVYTGYTYEQITSGTAGEAAKACLDYIDVLIDGVYVEEENTPDCVLRGSNNQRIIYRNETKREAYESYMAQGRVLETFSHEGKIIITGIMNREETK